MHESGIAARIVDVAVARASVAGSERITDVHLEIGADSGVAAESLELYWPQVSRATSAEGARLHIRPADDPSACRLVAIDVVDAADAAASTVNGPSDSGGRLRAQAALSARTKLVEAFRE